MRIEQVLCAISVKYPLRDNPHMTSQKNHEKRVGLTAIRGFSGTIPREKQASCAKGSPGGFLRSFCPANHPGTA